jgi:hypothetical protein
VFAPTASTKKDGNPLIMFVSSRRKYSKESCIGNQFRVKNGLRIWGESCANSEPRKIFDDVRDK